MLKEEVSIKRKYHNSEDSSPLDLQEMAQCSRVWDTGSHMSKDFFLNPICILFMIVCLYNICCSMYIVYK